MMFNIVMPDKLIQNLARRLSIDYGVDDPTNADVIAFIITNSPISQQEMMDPRHIIVTEVCRLHED